MTVTNADVLKLRDDLVASDPSLSPAQVRQGVRTLVHERLQAENPPPYPLPPAATGKTRDDFRKAHAAAMRIDKVEEREAELARIHNDEVQHLGERKAAMHLSVPTAVAVEFYKNPQGCNSPHHFAQKAQGVALWKQTDSIVNAALGGTT